MADLEKTVAIIFDGDNSKVKSVLGDTDTNLSKLETRTSSMSKSMKSMGTALIGFVAAAGGIGAAFAAAAVETDSAIRDIKNQLALTPEETDRISNVLRNVYKTGLSEGMEDAKQAVILAYRQMREGTDGEIEDMATKALILKDKFDIDISGAMGGVTRLMTDFGTTAETAFGFITKGAQDGINGSDDLIDTITEYGGLLSDAGFSAQEFYRLLKDGYQPGTTLGTDKVADLVKEFKIKLEEGATATKTAYTAIGINFDSLVTGIDNGTGTIATAFDDVVTELGKIPSKTEQFKLGQAIFGTPFEDLGTEIVTGLKDVIGGLPVEMANAIKGIDISGPETELKKLGRSFGAWFETAIIGAEPVQTAITFWTEKFNEWSDAVQAEADQKPMVVTGKIVVPEEILNQVMTVEAIEGESVAELEERISSVFPDEVQETVEMDADTVKAKEKVQDVVDKADELENTKMMEIQLQGEIDTQIAQIKTTAETAQAAFEWKAKVDIAQVQADTEVIKSMFTSVDTSINSTGETLTTLFGMLKEDLSISDSWLLRDAIEAEIEYREKAFENQSKLIDAQVALIEARTEALENGDGLIKIDSTGLEPALELVMWEILEKVQVRASENVQEFLLGM